MGEWIKRKADEHVCDYPRFRSEAQLAQVGDIWKCSCGRQYQVKGFDSGMQWDPYPTKIVWQPILSASVVPR